MPTYRISAFRKHDDPRGYQVADRIKVDSLEAAAAWVATNAMRAKGVPEVPFRAIMDASGIVQMVAEYDDDNDWWWQYIEQVDGIETVIIEREDEARRNVAAERFEGNKVEFQV